MQLSVISISSADGGIACVVSASSTVFATSLSENCRCDTLTAIRSGASSLTCGTAVDIAA